MKEIIFTNKHGLDFISPQPAIKVLPEWYKKQNEYISKEKKPDTNNNTPATVKKCMPVFDALTSGYILFTPVDVYVSQKDNMPYYQWSSQDAISFHPVAQANEHPAKNEFPYPKWMNQWAIKTPAGYSTLFIPPMHNPNNMFTVLEGVVDTDTYTDIVNFPFVLKDPSWEGMIPAGTPMVQVIPFKRDAWKMKIGGEKELKENIKIVAKLQTLFFNRYKTYFWSRKEYR
jgi:hypothetical protein